MSHKSISVTRIDVQEFCNLGFLHEVNRLVLHPAGLALEIITDDNTGRAVALGGVWDCREDPDGVIYGADLLDARKAATVANIIELRGAARMESLGYVVQPVDPDAKQLKVSVLEPTRTRIGPNGEYDEGEEQG